MVQVLIGLIGGLAGTIVEQLQVTDLPSFDAGQIPEEVTHWEEHLAAEIQNAHDISDTERERLVERIGITGGTTNVGCFSVEQAGYLEFHRERVFLDSGLGGRRSFAVVLGHRSPLCCTFSGYKGIAYVAGIHPSRYVDGQGRHQKVLGLIENRKKLSS